MKKKKKKDSKKKKPVSLPSIERLVGEVRSLVSHISEDIIRPRKFSSDEIHLLVVKLKDISNILVSVFYQDEFQLKALQRQVKIFQNLFEGQKVEISKICTDIFPHSETVKRAFDLLTNRFDTIFQEKFEGEVLSLKQTHSLENMSIRPASPLGKVLASGKPRIRKRRLSLVTPEKSRRLRTADENLYVKSFLVKEELKDLKKENKHQLRRIQELENESNDREVAGLIKVSREDAQVELIRKFRALQEKVRGLEKELWAKTNLLEEHGRKLGKSESKIRWLHRVVEKHSLRKKILERISLFESTRADLIKKQQSTIMSDSLVASVIDEQLSKVFETEESLIEEQRRRKRAEKRVMTLEVELKRERELRNRHEKRLEEMRTHPPVYSSDYVPKKVRFHREEVQVDEENAYEVDQEETRKLKRLYGGESPEGEEFIRPTYKSRNDSSRTEMFSRGIQTHKVRWCESYVHYIYHLMNEIYFINLNQKPDDQFLITFLKLFKAIRLIYRQMYTEDFINQNNKNIRELLPKPEEIVIPENVKKPRSLDITTIGKLNQKGGNYHEKRKRLRTSGGRRMNRTASNNMSFGGQQQSRGSKKVKKLRRPHTASSASKSYMRSSSSGARWQSRSNFQALPSRTPFQYFKSSKNTNLVSLKPISRRQKRY